MKPLTFKLFETAGDDGAAGGGEPANSRTIEDRALEMGWIPEADFRGDKAKFINAADFVKRAETFMPVLKANNRRLEGSVADSRRQNQVLQTQLNEALSRITELEKGHDSTKVESLKAKRDDLSDELKIAREAGNTRRESELQGEIAEVNAEISEIQKTPARAASKGNGNSDATTRPEFQEFLREHPWFGSDRRKTALANAIGEEIRANNPDLVGKAFFDRVTEELDKELGSRRNGGGAARVEGGSRGSGQGGGGSTGGGRTYNDLPPDAKEACRQQATRLVGDGKRYKDMAAWQKAYAETYFKD